MVNGAEQNTGIGLAIIVAANSNGASDLPVFWRNIPSFTELLLIF